MSKMYQVQEEIKEKAIVFCPIEKENDKEYQFAEISRLCFSAGMEVQQIFSQSVDAFNRRTIMGTGKLEEIKNYLSQNPCDCLVVDFQLTGSQLEIWLMNFKSRFWIEFFLLLIFLP